MNIIAFDTATDIFSIGLSTGDKNYYLTADSGQKHSELIMDAADVLMRIGGIAREELGAAACMEGPGSFTGLRIGFAAAKGLALALGITIIPVPTLDCMASPFSFWPGIVVPVMDAKKNAFFTALYRKGERLTPYLDTEMEGLINSIKDVIARQTQNPPPLLIAGPAAGLAFSPLTDAFPGAVCDTACRQGFAGELLNLAKEKTIIMTEPVVNSGPLYLRKSDAELMKQN